MSDTSDFNEYLQNKQANEHDLTLKIKTYLLLKLQKAKELQRPSLIVNAKNLMAEMNLKASPSVFAKAMLEVKKPTDEILYGKVSSPGATLTICYYL